MLVYSDMDARVALRGRPVLDRDATLRFARILFPREELAPMGSGDLSFTCPPDDELHIGCYPGVSIVAATEFGIDCPSQLPEAFVTAGGGGTVCLHAMHSVVDWFAYALWVKGTLLRSLSLSPDSGVLEDFGQRLPFEEPYWSGQHPVPRDEEEDDYPLPFHPLDLGEAALREFFGYQLEGFLDPTLLEPESVSLMRYRRAKSR